MKIYYLLTLFLATQSLWSQQQIVAELNLEETDCAQVLSKVHYEIQNANDQKLTEGNVSLNCNLNISTQLSAGNYLLYLQIEGFDDVFHPFQITENQEVNLGRIHLYLSQTLDEVSVASSQNNFIVNEADKTIFNIEDNETLNSGTLEETISKMPGVIVTPEGYIMYNGKLVSIWIDGQPSQLSGQDLMALLRSLPANIVEKIEIIPNPGAAYSADSSGGIINIITKNKSVKGFSGSFTNNFNYTRADNIQNHMSVNLNGRQNKWSYVLTMGNSYDNALNIAKNDRKVENENYIYQYENGVTTEKENASNFIRTSLSYALSENSNLNARFNYSQKNPQNQFHSFTENGSSLYTNEGNYQSDNHNKQFRLQYQTKLDTLDKNITAYFYYSFYKNNDFRPQTANYDENASLYSISNHQNHNYYYTGKVDASLPFARPTFTLELGGLYNFQYLRDLGRYNFNTMDETVLETPVYFSTIDYRYLQQNFAFYTQLKKTFGKLSATAGLRLENYKLIGKSNADTFYNDTFTNMYPSFFLLYDLSPLKLFANYSKKVDMPTYSELNPNLDDYFDDFTASTGNPNLRPRFSHNWEAKISVFEYLTFSADYSTTKNEVYTVAAVNGPEVIRYPEVFDQTERFNFSFQIPFPFAFIKEGMNILKRPDLSPNSLSYIVFFGSYNETIFSSDTQYFATQKPHYWWQGSYTNIILPKGFNVNMFQMYIPKGFFNQYQIEKPIWRIDLTLYKYLFDKNLKLSFGIRDVFNSYEQNIFYRQPNFQTQYYSKADSQKWVFSLTWNIGKYKQKNDTEMMESGANSSDNGIGF